MYVKRRGTVGNDSMFKIRAFLKRHVLWAGFFAVVAPLLSILALQYWSLLKLEKASPVAEKMYLKNFLGDVSKEVKYFYKTSAEETLTTPAGAVTGDGLQNTKYLFGKCDVEGAKMLFIASFKQNRDADVAFFDPHTQTRLSNPQTAVARAAQIAIAPMRLLGQEGAEMSSMALQFDNRDTSNPILFKPITNREGKVVGVTGMVLDTNHFKDYLLPQLVRATLPKYFPDEAQENIIVTLHNSAGQVIFATQPFTGQESDIWTGLPYFYDYHLSVRNAYMTPEQWAHWNFNFSLSLAGLLTLALLGGIVLALRVASREMRLSQMKTDFVSNVSHELRTPLSSIRVFGEFLKLGRVREVEKMREYGEYIDTESRRLTQLINNILDFSKIESDRKTYHFETADVGEVVADTLRIFDVQLKQHGFQIVYDAPDAPLPPAVIDADAIAQALLNLFDNAVKYSGEAKEILVELGHRDGFVFIAVSDHGLGIPRPEQAKIFEKFYRVSTGLVHDVKGSGLGLSLVKHIVKAHRGKVTVESEPGRGSRFTIYLPAVADAVSGKQQTPVAKPLIAGDAPPLSLGLKPSLKGDR